jgi:hypothetical protein
MEAMLHQRQKEKVEKVTSTLFLLSHHFVLSNSKTWMSPFPFRPDGYLASTIDEPRMNRDVTGA